ncbi:MAG: nucleotide sugar dehydrogenase [Candidatus Odinarchaeum yellowstonii]|jgi:UDP-N-acetyl-D-mannosaminuronic acid dehydrogenase|uniref:UDP-N-acetyl-D-mannosamine dehydrogenase n=1 Tax=Odinarchaeota yellowstonii (strain LCB_4) TaxID=1841599 RepID=A0AAF0IAT1_ODILC|nr:MAG: nucleotide sugar dehydrogenase [Candidatus Odinarchaeum yellowstonii]
MKVCVIGLGYIGLPTACLIAEAGHEVVGVDIKPDVINKLKSGSLPFKEKGLDELFNKVKNRMKFQNHPEDAEVFLIAVPTPLSKEARIADLSYVRKAVESIKNYVKKDTLVVVESTVPPGTCELIVAPLLNNKGLIAHCPERAMPGNTLYEMVHNARVIGANDDKAKQLAGKLYSSFVKGEIYYTNLKTAEMVKLMENTYRDINIALANEFAQIAEDIGVDIWSAIRIANKHPRVNILNPGPGVGGHCLAVDPWFLIENSSKSKIISLAREINDSMPKHVVELVKEMNIPAGETLTVLGVAYKRDVDDIRETPALKFIKIAENEGYNIKVHDPHVKEFEYPLLALDEAVSESSCIVIITDHSIFKEIQPSRIAILMKNKILIDTRNSVDHKLWVEAGFKVKVLGKGDIVEFRTSRR